MTEQHFQLAKQVRKDLRRITRDLANAEHTLWQVENGYISVFMEIPNGKSVEENLHDSIAKLRAYKVELTEKFAVL